MSESEGERTARSVALEQAYVHEVYEQCAEKTTRSKQWPRIYKFLEELEPGALVCDIGCGNGKYLSVNDNVLKVGADRCERLADIARRKENEVMICDNLALPFRDESFDAVLSIAVVHHFATTERRVNALKELARVLRIGGRLVISVWAMEQSRHRKFESQDVLVPWPKAYCLDARYRGDVDSSDDVDSMAQRCSVTSDSRGTGRGGGGARSKNQRYRMDPIFSPSPSTSSLSSPNETCYSFFRRALQKLAGGKRGGSGGWFLESWRDNGCKNGNFQRDDIGDVDDIPIELRRLEEDNVTPQPSSQGIETLGVKSKSLGDIIEIQRFDLARSRSSIPGFSTTLASEAHLDESSPPPNDNNDLPASTFARRCSKTSFTRRSSSSAAAAAAGKPRLVKQKTHLTDDSSMDSPARRVNENDESRADAGRIEAAASRRRCRVYKQSSMNEELLISTERLMERERVRGNITKQASLNEEIIPMIGGQTFYHFRDTLCSAGNATKRFQLIKSDLTNRIKQSTTGMEPAGMAIKNGFAKILQGWKQSAEVDESSRIGSLVDDENNDEGRYSHFGVTPATSGKKITSFVANGTAEPNERRPSKEDGSDSSKDSGSLQSDTSVDSEDSFASVIYVPKNQQQSQNIYHPPYGCNNRKDGNKFAFSIDVAKTISPTLPNGYPRLRTTSAPPSPRIKHRSDIRDDAVQSMLPLVEQFPATSKSLPPPSPPGLDALPVAATAAAATPRPIDQPGVVSRCRENNDNIEESTKRSEKAATPIGSDSSIVSSKIDECERRVDDSTSNDNDRDVRRARLNRIKELLGQKPGFATRSSSSSVEAASFPLVRRASAVTGRFETRPIDARTLPRLLSLELFNPETDDLDSDSSGLSSPESVGSVISVISDQRFSINDTADANEKKAAVAVDDARRCINEDDDESNEEIIVGNDAGNNDGIDRRQTPPYVPGETIDSSSSRSDCKYRRLVDDTIACWLSSAGTATTDEQPPENHYSTVNNSEKIATDLVAGQKNIEATSSTINDAPPPPPLRVDSIDPSSVSDGALFGSGTIETGITSERRDNRSATIDDDVSHRTAETIVNNDGGVVALSIGKRTSDVSLGESSSRESLASVRGNVDDDDDDEGGGGAITYHRYYHVFREGELDQLINKYVENLHIISSYYDHASWCIVAEKVQVWTI